MSFNITFTIFYSYFYCCLYITIQNFGDLIMKLKYFLQILEQFDVESEIDFDVKAIESIVDFGRLSDVYSDDETVIIEIR